MESLGDGHPLVAIVGPTAAGKSALALALAERLGGEIVNCDSVQIYRGFDVGAGKTPPEERRGLPHHLLDCADLGRDFTAGDYRAEASRVVEAVRKRGGVPILVGGAGLYLRALLLGLFEGPARSEALRLRLKGLAEERGNTFLQRMLRRLDPPSAARIHPRDTAKTIRALEVCWLARRPMSEMLAQGRQGLKGFQVFKVGLMPERRLLYQRINLRVERMFASGILDETRRALERPDADRLKPLGALGYRQACSVIRGEQSVEEAVKETQRATRRYAKRQITWFRREPDVNWFAGFGEDPEIQQRVFEGLQQALQPGHGARQAPRPLAPKRKLR